MSDLISTIGTIVISSDGKILLIHEGEKSEHITGIFGLVSGRVEEGETEQEAALRELKEETGLHAKLTDFKKFENNYFTADIPRKDGTIAKMGWRVYKLEKFTGDLKEGDEETVPVWFEQSQIEQMDKEGKLLPNVLNAIHAALK